jgi:DNA-binding NarL/FixJ family response regulator
MTALRVVIVDDKADIRHLLGLLLATAGHQVVGEAPDGRVGVTVALTLAPDLVIMDWQMPEMDGVEATRRICEQSPGLRVIAFSSASDPGMRAAFLAAGAFAYHDKADIDGLEASVAQVADLVLRGR